MKYTQPLFIQSIMTVKGLYDSKPAKVYLMGQPATGDLKRPWLAAAPGAGLFGGKLSCPSPLYSPEEKWLMGSLCRCSCSWWNGCCHHQGGREGCQEDQVNEPKKRAIDKEDADRDSVGGDAL